MIASVLAIAIVGAAQPLAHASRVAAPSKPAAAERAAAEPSDRTDAPTWANVAVDTSGVGEAGPAVRRRVQERADVVLRNAGVLPGRGPDDPTIRVIIREVQGERPGWSYRVFTDAGQGDATAEDSCDLCTETELVDAIEGRVAIIAAALRSAAERAAAAGAPVSTQPPPPRIADPQGEQPQPHGRVGPTGKAGFGPTGKVGFGLIGVGVGGIVAGAVLAALPAHPKPGEPLREIYTQPPGYALLAAGGTALVIGTALVLADRYGRKRRGRAVARRP
ncbi:MAG: hypothetical protein IPK74_07830 [Deltaproteobacteria bacterium]|nr:hypothetical protein [Deltaproteobacteria bacterium]